MFTNFETAMHIAEIQEKRFSPKEFSPSPIPDEEIRSLFEAIRVSPSSMNIQPWAFVFARRGTNEFKLMLELLYEKNREWAKNSAVLVLAFVKKENPRIQQNNFYALYDLGGAMANLVVRATASGIYVHQMGGFDRQKANNMFPSASGYEPAVVAALGYLPDDFENSIRHLNILRSRKRMELSEFVFEGYWGNTAEAVKDVEGEIYTNN